jgi:hypothetical protein
MVPEGAVRGNKDNSGTQHPDVPARTEHPKQPVSREDVAVTDQQSTPVGDPAVASEIERAPRQEACKAGDTVSPPAEGVRNSDNGHGLSQEQESGENGKAYVDGHEIEVTGNPADGIWIKGLPGKVPDKTGDVLAGRENTKRSREGEFFSTAVEGADDLYDGFEKLTSVGYDALRPPPPTHAEVGISSGHPTLDAPQHYAPDVGGIATGILTLGILGWAASHKIHDWIGKRAERAHDASN